MIESRGSVTPEQVREIKSRYKNENVTYSELSEDYPIGETGIGNIIRGDSWKHID